MGRVVIRGNPTPASNPTNSHQLPKVNNSTPAFLVNGKPADFIFANLNGTTSAWNGGTTAQVEWTTPGEPIGCDCLLL